MPASISPPPPWTTVLRASSLTAVTSLVWSIRRSPASWASSRMRCRARTTSSSEISGCASSVAVSVLGLLRDRPELRTCRGEHDHAALDGQRGAHAGQRQSKLDEGDGHGGPHADDDG